MKSGYDFHNAYKDGDQNIDISYGKLDHNVGMSNSELDWRMTIMKNIHIKILCKQVGLEILVYINNYKLSYCPKCVNSYTKLDSLALHGIVVNIFIHLWVN